MIICILAVAMAFQEKLILNPELKDICMNFYKTSDINCPGMKLAFVSIKITSVHECVLFLKVVCKSKVFSPQVLM